MVSLRAFALFRHFYFNYNYVDSNIPYIHSLFTRRVQFSIRIVISFLASGFLAYGSPLEHQLSQSFLIPLISVLTIQDTVGFTIAYAFQMLITLVPTSIFLFIVQKIGLGYQDYVAAEFILLITAFFIGFIGSQVRTSQYIQFASGFLVVFRKLDFLKYDRLRLSIIEQLHSVLKI
jgi:hypothetical protein